MKANKDLTDQEFNYIQNMRKAINSINNTRDFITEAMAWTRTNEDATLLAVAVSSLDMAQTDCRVAIREYFRSS